MKHAQSTNKKTGAQSSSVTAAAAALGKGSGGGGRRGPNPGLSSKPLDTTSETRALTAYALLPRGALSAPPRVPPGPPCG